ncbi:MAG: hypothetical protein ABSC05_05245 [Candidatus Solibacter sp.]
MREVALFDYNQWKYYRTLDPVVYWPAEMEDAVQPSREDLRVSFCPRCLQPVPPKASHCPGCRQPIHALRLLPWIFGAAGFLVLLFGLMFALRTMRNEPKAAAPVEEAAPQPDGISSEPLPAVDTPSPPPKPEKRPPLNER